MNKNKTSLKEKYFIKLYKEWDNIVSKKQNLNNTKDNCTVCNSKKNQIIFIKKKLKFCICSICSHVFINPFIKSEVLEKHFEKSKTWGIWSKKILNNKNQQILEKKKYKLGIKEIKKFGKIKNILDIGSASGSFLNICKKMDYNVEGIEPSKESSDYARKKYNINIHNSTFSKFKSPKKYDLITCWASIEYSNTLRQDIKKIKNLLNKKGKLLIYISGNSNSIIMRILRSYCLGFIFNRRNYFNPKSLDYLLSNSGFKLKKILSDNNNLNSLENFVNYQNPYRASHSNSFLINHYFPEKIVSKKILGYKFLSIYEKK